MTQKHALHDCRLISVTQQEPTPFEIMWNAKVVKAERNCKNASNSLTKISAGFYIAVSREGIFQITSPREGHEKYWQADFFPNNNHIEYDREPSDRYEFDTLTAFREWLKGE